MQPERYSGPLELRADGRRLIGPAVRYADIAPDVQYPDGGRGPERFEPGAFTLDDGRTRYLDIGHDQERVIAFEGAGLELRDSAEALTVEATLPPIPAANRALKDVQAGKLRGFSVEFHAKAETRTSGIRVIERADLVGVGLVSRPAYPDSLAENRGQWKKAAMQPGARKRPWARSTVRVNRTSDCECIRSDGILQVRFEREAFRPVLEAVRRREHVVQAVIGNTGPHNNLGTTASGALRLTRAQNGDLMITLTEAAGMTPAGQSLVSADAGSPAVIRPLVNHDLSEWQDVDGVRVYSLAWLAVLLFKAAPNRRGWEGLQWWVPDDTDDELDRPRRLPWWMI